jgi:hypothetical protein
VALVGIVDDQADCIDQHPETDEEQLTTGEGCIEPPDYTADDPGGGHADEQDPHLSWEHLERQLADRVGSGLGGKW